MSQQLVKPKFTGLKNLFGGKIPHGHPINIFGSPLAGKSLMTMQTAVEHAAQKEGNILVIDVDSGFDLFWDVWQKTMRERFDFKGELFIEDASNLPLVTSDRQTLMKWTLPVYKLFGVDAKVEISSEGSKSAFMTTGVTKDKVSDYFTNKKVCVMLIDSVSQIYKDCFLGLASYGERARAEDCLYGLIKSIVIKNKQALYYLSHHESVNPMRQTSEIAGGRAILQNSKLAVYIEKLSGQDMLKFGRLYLYRYPNVITWGREQFFKKTDLGIIDSSVEEINQALAERKKRWQKKEE